MRAKRKTYSVSLVGKGVKGRTFEYRLKQYSTEGKARVAMRTLKASVKWDKGDPDLDDWTQLNLRRGDGKLIRRLTI